jgi:zinc transport system substrate-binding protein
MRNLAQSDAFITIGLLPFEQSLISNIKANNPQLIIARVDSAITFIHGTHEHRHGTHEHHSDNGAVDPHIWSSVNNAPIIAQNVLNALVAAAPNHANYYRQRFDSLATQLHSMKAEFDSCFMDHPTTDFLIWHPALSYFARDYGMSQIPLNIENKETSPLQLKQAIDRAAIGNASLLIMPEGTPADRAAAITAKLGIKTVPVLLMTADWDNSMRQLLSTFTSNQ